MARLHFRFNPFTHLFDSAGIPESLRRSLFYVVVSIMFGTVSTIVTTGAAWTGFLRRLGADAFALGIIAAIPVAASSVQILISYWIERTGRRRELFLRVGLIGRFLWVPVGLIPFFVPMNPDGLRVAIVMLFVAVCSCSNAIISVGFFSLVTDIVPMRIRGRYFSARAMVSLIIAVITGLLISLLIDHTSGYTGYTIALIIAGLFGAADIACFLRVDWPEMKRSDTKPPSLPSMIAAVWKHADFRRIMLVMTCWGFVVNLAAPFYNLYMLEVVRMSYTRITLINQVVPNVTGALVIAWWGRRMDEYGNKPVMRTAGVAAMIYPLLFMASGAGVFGMLIVANMLSGLMTYAFELGSQNLYMNAAPDMNRSMFLSVYFACTQLLGNAIASSTGGYLLENVTPSLERLGWTFFGFPMTRYHYLFLLSGILRITFMLILLPTVREDSSQPVRRLVVDSSREISRNASVFVHSIVYSIRRKRLRRKMTDSGGES